MSAAITYEQLKRVMTERVGQEGLPGKNSLPNLTTALGGFMCERGLNESEAVRSTLRVCYYKARDAHLRALEEQGRSKSYIANRKSLLSHWHRLVLALDREDGAARGKGGPLQTALREVFASGASVTRTGRETGVPVATLRNWLRGSTPRADTVKHLVALERFFGMQPATLTDLVTSSREAGRGTSLPCPIEYRVRLRALCSDPYLLKPSAAIKRFRNEWQAWCQYKARAFTSTPGLLADDAGKSRRWRLLPKPVDESNEDDWVGIIAGHRCPTAEINFHRVAQYLGWLQLDRARGGLGLPPEKAQTLAQLANESYLIQFIDWKVKRSGGFVNSWAKVFVRMVGTLCHPVHGFLINTPKIRERVGVKNLKTWKTRCHKARKFALRASRNLETEERPARDPFEPIQAILALNNPLDAIADAVRRLDAARPATTGMREAVWARDRLLLALSASNPLRARNLQELTWREDNTGQLRQDARGVWRIVIPRHDFKNYNGAAKDRNYDMAIQEEIWPFLQRYLRDYRPMLVRAGADRVFGSSRSPNGAWNALNRRFEYLTRRYIHGCPGVGPQAMRHIVATGVLKSGGNVGAAALILHDREETVRTHYAHLISDDGAKWLREALGDAFRRM